MTRRIDIGGDLIPGITDPSLRMTIQLLVQRINEELNRPSASSSDDGVPSGVVFSFPGLSTSVPSGYLLCDGTAYSANDYPNLYAAIGNTWATCRNQSTGSAYSSPATGYFRVPDFRGVFIRGVGTSVRPGGGDSVTVTLAGMQEDKMRSHNHKLWAANGGSPSAGNSYVLTYDNAGAWTQNFFTTSSESSSNVGTMPHMIEGDSSSAYATDTRPRNVGSYYIIKT